MICVVRTKSVNFNRFKLWLEKVVHLTRAGTLSGTYWFVTMALNLGSSDCYMLRTWPKKYLLSRNLKVFQYNSIFSCKFYLKMNSTSVFMSVWLNSVFICPYNSRKLTCITRSYIPVSRQSSNSLKCGRYDAVLSSPEIRSDFYGKAIKSNFSSLQFFHFLGRNSFYGVHVDTINSVESINLRFLWR